MTTKGRHHHSLQNTCSYTNMKVTVVTAKKEIKYRKQKEMKREKAEDKD